MVERWSRGWKGWWLIERYSSGVEGGGWSKGGLVGALKGWVVEKGGSALAVGVIQPLEAIRGAEVWFSPT